jgi:hypothetical protein
MLGLFRLAALLAVSVLVCSCATTPDHSIYSPDGSGPATYSGGRIERPAKPLECVPFARAESGVNLVGDAWTWWDLAAGRYERASEPKLGSVLLLTGYAGPHRGHVAVVRAIDSARQIRVDHANWLDDGRIYRDDPVIDVSPDNDWTEVRVWNLRDNTLGARIYPVRGFIGPGREGRTDRVANRD